MSSRIRSWTDVGSAAEPEISTRAPANASASPRSDAASAGDPPVHRRHAEHHRGAALERARQRCRREPADVLGRAAAAQRPEHPDDQPVHVEHRQGVSDAVRSRPLPDLGQRVEIGRDRAAGICTPLGGPVVPDVYITNAHVLGAEVVGEGGAGDVARGQIDVDTSHTGQFSRRRDPGPREQLLGRAVLHDVPKLARAEAGVDRDDAHTRGQRPDDRDAQLERRLGPHRDPARAVQAGRQSGRRGGQVRVGQRPVRDANRLPLAGAGAKLGKDSRSSPLRRYTL